MTSAPPGQWRLLSAAVLGWVTVAWLITAPGTAKWMCCAVVIVGIAIWAQFPGVWRLFALICAILVVLGARVEFSEWQRQDPELSQVSENGIAVEARAIASGFPSPSSGGFGHSSWVRAELQAGRGDVPVLLWMSAPPDDRVSPGVEVTVSGRMARLDPASSAAFGVTVDRIVTGEPNWLQRMVTGLRVGLRESAKKIDGASLVPGFAVGDTSLVEETLTRDMLQSSLTHLVAVSGANCALVTSAMIGLASVCGAGRRSRTIIAAFALGGFVLVVGPDASVQRAAIMAAVVLLSGYGGKRAVALPALGVAIILLLVIDPWQALQPGFALSVTATAGILLLVPPVSSALQRSFRLPRWLILPIAVAVAAQLSCGPLLLLLQPGLPASGVLANVLAAFAAPLGTGLGLVSMLVLPVVPQLGTALVHVAALPARWVAATAEVCAALPLARWYWPEGWAGACLLAAVELMGLLAWLLLTGRLSGVRGEETTPRRPWTRRHAGPRSVRLLGGALCSGALALFTSVTLVVPVTARVGVPNDWAIVVCDVGQGDAILIRDPERQNEVMLFDTGDEPEMLHDCLDRFSVKRLALLVLTHDHRDHIGALDAVASAVEQALIAPPTRDDGAGGRDRSLPRRLDEFGIPYAIGSAGTTSSPGAAVEWEILAPEQGTTPPDSNAGSLVMQVGMGNLTALMLGDTGREQHSALRSNYPDLTADLVKVAHHGSRDEDGTLLAMIDAEIGLISVGAANSYGHPSPDLLDSLQRAGTVALRTDQLGSIAISGEPGKLRVWSERSAHSVGPPE